MRVGLLGWGIGNLHGRSWHAIPEVEVVAIADLDSARRKNAADLLSAKAYNSAQELLDQADVDIVDVCLPTYMHAEYAIKALNKGCHVLCEKPMALHSPECDAMIAAAQRNEKTLMIAHCVRFWPEYSYLKQVYDQGTYGKLQILSMTRVGAKSIRSFDNWQLDPERSGSQTVDRHIHDTDFIIHMLGLPQAVRSCGFADVAGVSHINTQYIYPGGPAVFAEGGGNIPLGVAFSASFRAVFDQATLEYCMNGTPTMRVYPWEGEPFTPQFLSEWSAKASIEETGANISDLGAYFNEIRYFLTCLRNGEKPTVVTPEQAKQTVAVAQAEVASVLQGREIPI